MYLNPEKANRYIICRQGKYLVGNPYDSLSAIRYSTDKYDGVRFKDFDDAIRVAKIMGGKVMRFNLLTGEVSGGWK
ncbi:MAG: hypothetical protein J6Y60_03375 [Treponema sp.]|nr:hypothetical protein [Treponema sp.]